MMNTRLHVTLLLFLSCKPNDLMTCTEISFLPFPSLSRSVTSMSTSATTISVDPPVISLKEGEQVVFTCRNSAGSSVKWRLPDGSVLGPQPSPEGARVFTSGILLSISETVYEDRGVYTCLLTDDETLSATAELRITGSLQ